MEKEEKLKKDLGKELTFEEKVKEKELYIFGHKNPDTDSICSTLAYASLKRKLGYKNVYACRLGNINKETRYVLNAIGLSEDEYPMLIDSIKPRVSELKYYDTGVIGSREDVRTAKIKMKEGGVSRRILPVVSDSGRLIGIISNSNIVKCLERFYESEELNLEIYVANLLDNLEPFDVIGEYKHDKVIGNIYIDTIAVDRDIKDGDLIVSTNEEFTKSLLERKKDLLIVVPNSTRIGLLEDYAYDENGNTTGTMIIKSKYGLLHTLHEIAQAISVYSLMTTGDLEYFEKDEYIEDIKPIVVESKFTHFPIVDKDNKVQGVLSRRHLLRIQKRNVILIDHNEIGQTINGIKEANILEIIDHHKVDTIMTEYPPFFRIEPVGCTSTVVYKLFKENEVEVDKREALLMISAILSDTLCLHSPTCTMQDVHAAEELAKIAEVDIETYGRELLSSSLNIEDDEWKETMKSDIKKFNVGDYYVEISNINVANYEELLPKKEMIKNYMYEIMREDRCDTFVMMFTDIINKGAYIIYIGENDRIFNSAFSIPYGEDSIFMPGVLSRKKQVLPKVISAIEKLIK